MSDADSARSRTDPTARERAAAQPDTAGLQAIVSPGESRCSGAELPFASLGSALDALGVCAIGSALGEPAFMFVRDAL